MSEPDDTIDYKSKYQELLYAISHDLSAPVRHTSNFYSLLIEEHESTWNEDQIEYQTFINKALKKAEHQFERLLVLSRLHSRQSKKSTFPLFDCVTQVISVVEEELDQQIDVTLNIEKTLMLELPINLLKQALYELLKNAFIHGCSHETPRIYISGTIEQTSRKKESHYKNLPAHHQQPQQERLLISVNDNGTGMNENVISKSVLPFSRFVENTVPGVGLGLTIAQQACEIMGGNLALVSVEGLQAIIKIPVNHSVSDTEQSPKKQSQKEQHI